MAFPWLVALKVIPWGDVIEHAPKVLKSARKLLDKQGHATDVAPVDRAPATHDEAARWAALHAEQQRLQADLQQLAQTATELAEQNTQLIEAVEVLRWRTRWLGVVAVVLLAGWVALWIKGL
jgi:hypothetical protein